MSPGPHSSGLAHLRGCTEALSGLPGNSSELSQEALWGTGLLIWVARERGWGVRESVQLWVAGVLGGKAGNCSGEDCVRLSMAQLSLVGAGAGGGWGDPGLPSGNHTRWVQTVLAPSTQVWLHSPGPVGET